MSNLKNKRILILQQRGWAKTIGHFLAKRLQAEGCELAAITIKKTTDKFIREQKEVKYKYIVNVDEMFEDPYKILGDEKITLGEVCKELNIDSVWPLIHSNRFFIRSYKEKFFYSFKQHVSDEFIAAYLKAHYKSVRDLFKRFKPDAIFMAFFVYEGHILLNLFADKHKIPIIAVTDSKIPGHYIFSYNYQDKKGPLIDRFTELNQGQKKSVNIYKAKEYIKNFREEFVKPLYMESEKPLSLIKRIRRELFPYKQIWQWYFNKATRANFIKNIDPSVDYRPPKYILRDHYCKKKYSKFAKKFRYYPFKKINKFVYFPLQFTPEGSTDLTCPLFSNQLELARQIAMSLPGDYTLVVKEHPSMVGFRTPSYYEKISRTPNVKLIDYRISADEILKKANLIIGSYSTVLAEAAFYWKPAILLSDVGIFPFFPNVFKHSDILTLSKKIKELLSINLETEKYERQLENYVAAVFDVGFTINYRNIWFKADNKDRNKLINKFIEEIKNNLNENRKNS